MENIIEISKLTKKFGNFEAVNNVSFNVKKGEVFAFLGPNGAGKTTTIRMLTTLLDPTSGEILVNGFKTVGHKSDVRKSFGIVFQDPSLDNVRRAQKNKKRKNRGNAKICGP